MRVLVFGLTIGALMFTGVPLVSAQKDTAKKFRAVLMGGPEVGRRAPDFSLPWANQDGVGPIESPYQLASDRGRTVVVAFYPRDFTKGCTAQLQTFAEQYDSLFGPDVTVVGISTDSVATHSRFAASLKLPFRLLSDPDQRVSKQYASKDAGGYNRRTVYVIGPDGRVKYRNMKFNALDPRAYSELRTAVKTVPRQLTAVLLVLAESRVSLGLAAALWCGAAAPLVAQVRSDGRTGPVWTINGLSAGQCVRFLVDPGAARRGLYEMVRLLPAGQDKNLHSALRSVIDGQPEYATWIPASLCLFYSDALDLGGRRFRGKDPRRRQMIGVWSLAATEQGGARRDILLDFVGVGGGLSQAAANAKVKLSEVQSSVSKVPGTDNDLYDVKIGKTRLTWNGRAVGDSTRVDQPIQESWLGKGTSGTVWRIQATFRPEWSRALVGTLSVEGKDDLAKALKASPIRFVGPVYRGGGGELHFSR